MQIQVDIGFDDLIRIVNKLPEDQLLKFKKELEKQNTNDTQLQDLESFLLTAPTFSDKQLEEIERTRKVINQWRKK